MTAVNSTDNDAELKAALASLLSPSTSTGTGSTRVKRPYVRRNVQPTIATAVTEANPFSAFTSTEAPKAKRAYHRRDPNTIGAPDERKNSLYVPETEVDELRAMKEQAARLGVSFSSVVMMAWRIARQQIEALPSSEGNEPIVG